MAATKIMTIWEIQPGQTYSTSWKLPLARSCFLDVLPFHVTSYPGYDNYTVSSKLSNVRRWQIWENDGSVLKEKISFTIENTSTIAIGVQVWANYWVHE